MGQREIDNMLLSMIQKHFPALPLSDEYTDWGKWLGFARAAYEAGRASPASAPEGWKLVGMGAERELALLGQIERQSAALKLAREALGEVQDLIGESHGVYGLHLNGDESPWGELEQGGRFERLTLLNEALAAIDSLQKGE